MTRYARTGSTANSPAAFAHGSGKPLFVGGKKPPTSSYCSLSNTRGSPTKHNERCVPASFGKPQPQSAVKLPAVGQTHNLNQATGAHRPALETDTLRLMSDETASPRLPEPDES